MSRRDGERVLSTRELNRALLARQLLLERSALSLPRALEQLAGIQAQYAPSAYIRLWSCLRRFALADLTRALERRRAVQGTLMRSTIHVVSARDYWFFADGVGQSRQAWWLRVSRKTGVQETDLHEAATALRDALSGHTWKRAELDAFRRKHGSPFWEGVWVALVRVPPSGTWERRRADLYRLASEWLGPSDADEERGLEHLLRRYLAGFGPAQLADAASWAGVPVTSLRPAAGRLQLRGFRDERGRALLDLPRAPLPPPDAPAPPRFLPWWDAALLVHARRTLVLPEEYRPLIFHTKAPQSFATFLVDGAVAGTWRWERAGDRATLVLEPFDRLARGAGGPLRDEGEGLIRGVEPDAGSYRVRVAARS